MTHMPLADVLSEYTSGNEWQWHTEWACLDAEDADRLDALHLDVEAHGMLTPVLLGDDGRVWDGHHRLRVADLLGLTVVPVEVVA